MDPAGWAGIAAWHSGTIRLLRGLVADPPHCVSLVVNGPQPPSASHKSSLLGVCGVFPPGLGE